MIKATLRGVGQMVGTLKKFAEKYPDRVATALYQEAQIEATEMKKRTPVDTRDNAPHPGNLRNSIHVLDPERRGRTISVEIATGTQAPYAVYVHENPDAFHPVGEWKFMESVLNESRPHMADRIARRIHLSRVRL
jgi:hypothetical protein